MFKNGPYIQENIAEPAKKIRKIGPSTQKKKTVEHTSRIFFLFSRFTSKTCETKPGLSCFGCVFVFFSFLETAFGTT